MSKVQIVNLGNKTSDKGTLVAIEPFKNVPFPISRIFYVYGVRGREVRGRHAHKVCQQFLISLNGTCEVICDDGYERRTFLLDSPTEGLLIPPLVWAEQKYLSDDSILLVLADQLYDESDYLRSYPEFKAIATGSTSSLTY